MEWQMSEDGGWRTSGEISQTKPRGFETQEAGREKRIEQFEPKRDAGSTI